MEEMTFLQRAEKTKASFPWGPPDPKSIARDASKLVQKTLSLPARIPPPPLPSYALGGGHVWGPTGAGKADTISLQRRTKIHDEALLIWPSLYSFPEQKESNSLSLKSFLSNATQSEQFGDSTGTLSDSAGGLNLRYKDGYWNGSDGNMANHRPPLIQIEGRPTLIVDVSGKYVKGGAEVGMIRSEVGKVDSKEEPVKRNQYIANSGSLPSTSLRPPLSPNACHATGRTGGSPPPSPLAYQLGKHPDEEGGGGSTSVNPPPGSPNGRQTAGTIKSADSFPAGMHKNLTGGMLSKSKQAGRAEDFGKIPELGHGKHREKIVIRLSKAMTGGAATDSQCITPAGANKKKTDGTSITFSPTGVKTGVTPSIATPPTSPSPRITLTAGASSPYSPGVPSGGTVSKPGVTTTWMAGSEARPHVHVSPKPVTKPGGSEKRDTSVRGPPRVSIPSSTGARVEVEGFLVGVGARHKAGRYLRKTRSEPPIQRLSSSGSKRESVVEKESLVGEVVFNMALLTLALLTLTGLSALAGSTLLPPPPPQPFISWHRLSVEMVETAHYHPPMNASGVGDCGEKEVDSAVSSASKSQSGMVLEEGMGGALLLPAGAILVVGATVLLGLAAASQGDRTSLGNGTASENINDSKPSRMKKSFSVGDKVEGKEKPRIRTMSTNDILASHKGDGDVRYMQSEGGFGAEKSEGEGREFIWRLWRGGRVEVTCGSLPLYEIRHRGMTIV